MTVIPSTVLVKTRESLQRIQHPEVLLWNDDDLKTAVFENSPKWFELLKWLLIKFDDSYAWLLENVEQSSMIRSLQDIVISLGLLPSEEAHKCVSGKVCIVEREKMCNMLFRAIEKCSKDESKELYVPAETEETGLLEARRLNSLSFEEYRAFVKMLEKGGKKESKNSFFDTVKKLHEDSKKCVDLENESLEQKKLECGMREDLTSVEHLEELKEKRRILIQTLEDISSSVKHLWEKAIETYKSELEPPLAENIGEARKMPMLKELSKSMDCLIQHQKVQETVKESFAVLQERSNIDRELEWSVKNTESLPVKDCFKQASSVNAQIEALTGCVNMNLTAVDLDITSMSNMNFSMYN